MSEMPPPLPRDRPTNDEHLASSDKAVNGVDEGKARIFPCDGCGADLEFHIGAQELKCSYCGFKKELQSSEEKSIEEQDFHAMLAQLKEMHGKNGHEENRAKEVRCDACGGTVVFSRSLTSSECPYCASPIQLENVHDAEHRIPVSGVLPFLVDKKKAMANLKSWVESLWFSPNDFKEKGRKGKFNGIYLPYWTFDTLTANQYTGQRGENYTVTVGSGKNERTEIRTRWYSASGSFQHFFDDVLVLATRGLPRNLMQELEPWPLSKCIPFTQEALAGYLARTYEVELPEGFREGKKRIDEAIENEVRQRIGGDKQRVHSINTRYNGLSFKHLLLPVWLLAYRYNDKSYQIMINASTGEVQGERPYSWIKITLAVLSGVTVIVGSALLAQR